MAFVYEEKYSYPVRVMLNLTDNCNLACRYCFVQQKPNYMTLQVAKDAVDFIVKNYNIRIEKYGLKDRKGIFFFGGEPTLMFDSIIVPLMQYIEETYNLDEFDFGITTNGTLLNKERIDFLKKYNIFPLLSIDGNAETQNYNRPYKNGIGNSFDAVVKNIPYLIENFPEVCFRSTIYKDSVKNLYNDFLFAESLGFKNYTCITDSRSVIWNNEELQELYDQLEKIIFHQIEYFLKGERPKITVSGLYDAFRDIILSELYENREKELRRTPWRCGLGTNGCSINYKGDLFSCQEQDSRNTNEYFYMGNIYTGVDLKKHKQILDDYMNNSDIICKDIEECIDCPLINICSGGCVSVNKDLYNNINFVNPVVCKERKYYYKLAMGMMLILNNNSTFFYYLDEISSHFLPKD